MEAPEALFDEAHLQSLASSLGKKQNVNGLGAYVKDPQCHGAFSSFSNRELSRHLVEISAFERRVFGPETRAARVARLPRLIHPRLQLPALSSPHRNTAGSASVPAP